MYQNIKYFCRRGFHYRVGLKSTTWLLNTITMWNPIFFCLVYLDTFIYEIHKENTTITDIGYLVNKEMVLSMR